MRGKGLQGIVRQERGPLQQAYELGLRQLTAGLGVRRPEIPVPQKHPDGRRGQAEQDGADDQDGDFETQGRPDGEAVPTRHLGVSRISRRIQRSPSGAKARWNETRASRPSASVTSARP